MKEVIPVVDGTFPEEPLKKTGKIKLEDIAVICGVSISSVSRALNNEPGISTETRKKVLEAAAEHNFILPKRKRPLARSQLKLLVVVPEESELSVNPFLNISELISAINEAFAEDKKSIEIISIEDFISQMELEIPGVDGILFAYRDINDEQMEFLKKGHIPYVFLSRVMKEENYVVCNGYKSVLEVTAMLLKKGCQRIGYFGHGENRNNMDRFRGYRTALLESGVDLDESLAYCVDDMLKINEGCADYFIERNCDAVVCFNDYLAIKLMNSLKERGKRIPADISVTGFDDSPLRKIYKPLLTTVRLPSYDMGFLAARWLRDNILNKSNRDLRIEIDGELVEGESVRS